MCVKDGTFCAKNGTYLREEWHPYVKNGTFCVKNGTRGSGEPQLREKWHLWRCPPLPA